MCEIWYILTDRLISNHPSAPLFHPLPHRPLYPSCFMLFFNPSLFAGSDFVSSDLNVCPAAEPLMARIVYTPVFNPPSLYICTIFISSSTSTTLSVTSASTILHHYHQHHPLQFSIHHLCIIFKSVSSSIKSRSSSIAYSFT